jgi:choline transport protein
VLLILLLFAGVVALIAIQQTASRLTWSFARDNAVLGCQYIGRVHDKLGVPVWALIANATVVSIIGCIFLGSTTAFNAFINTGLILQQVTFAIPAALLVLQGRPVHLLPVKRPFRLPGVVGWVVNFVTIAFSVVAVIFYNFPVELPVTSSNMSEWNR